MTAPFNSNYGQAGTLLYRQIDLSTARTAVAISVPEHGSDGFYCDHRTDGTADLLMDESNAYPFPVRAQSGMRVEFRRLFISNDAQAGKKLHLWIGRGFHFLQPTSLINTIDLVSRVAAITPPSIATSSYYRYSTTSALNTIVAPGSNTAGVRVSRGVIGCQGGGPGINMRLMMKQSAPSAWNDSAAITLAQMVATGQTQEPWESEFIVPAGYGLYEQSDTGTYGTFCAFGYEVLP